MLGGAGNQQGAHPAATADIHCMLDPLGAVLEVIADDLGKAVTVRAEEHGIAGVGWIRRMQQQ
ncbi:hypothetical protein D3C79_762040 [compost metagenome]